jgi:hypothetical protein
MPKIGTTPLVKYKPDVQAQLDDRERRFVHEYCKDYDGIRALKVAGFTGSLGAHFARLMKKVVIQKAIGAHQYKQLSQCDYDAERLRQEIGYAAFRDIIQLVDEEGVFITDDLRQIPEPMRRCINHIEIRQVFGREGEIVGQQFKIKLVDKLLAMQLYGKMIGAIDHEYQSMFHVGGPSNPIDWNYLYLEDGQADTLALIEKEIADIVVPAKNVQVSEAGDNGQAKASKNGKPG